MKCELSVFHVYVSVCVSTPEIEYQCWYHILVYKTGVLKVKTDICVRRDNFGRAIFSRKIVIFFWLFFLPVDGDNKRRSRKFPIFFYRSYICDCVKRESLKVCYLYYIDIRASKLDRTPNGYRLEYAQKHWNTDPITIRWLQRRY